MIAISLRAQGTPRATRNQPAVHRVAAPAGRPLQHKARNCVCRIGFSFDDSSVPDGRNDIESIQRGTATLLLYQQVLEGPPAQAFQEVMKALDLRNAGAALQWYAVLQQSCRDKGSASWADYVHGRILHTYINQFAKECERNGVHQPVFLPMVQHDLRVLERLAVDEVSLITWIQECASNSSGYRDTSDVSSWARAATSAVQARNLEAGAEGTEGPAGLFDKPVGELLEPPPSQAEIQAWKQFLFSSGASGGFHEDAASMLARYYSRYGAGLAGQIVHLHWRKGRFVRPVSATIPQAAAKGDAIEDGKVDGALLLLREALRRSPGSAQKPGSSSDRVLSTPNNSQPWEQLLDVEPGVGCRFVHLAAEDTADLPALLKALKERRRCWFVLCIRDISGKAGTSLELLRLLHALKVDLDGHELPPNVCIVTSPRA